MGDESSTCVEGEVCELEDEDTDPDLNLALDELIEEQDPQIAALGIEIDLTVLDTEQAEALTADIEEMEPEQVFIPIPLVARVTTGVSTVKALVQKQRELISEQAKVAAETGDSVRPPEARVSDFTNAGGV